MASLLRVFAPYLIALLVGLAAGWWVNGNRWEARHNEVLAEQQAASVATITRLLEREREWAERFEEVQANADNENSRLAGELADYQRDNLGLQQTIRDLQGRHADDPAATAECRAAARAARVSAELLGEAVGLAGVYAEEADRVRIVANSCHASFEALRGK